ncbi:hypothetical protein Vadar_031748 [Vaccinium darrowii]|uniref:Uncharacterized protein n=2 Tax=Vaccinium darrowii TaxID=229202 RepID=A0ACB7YKA7_9ERIC|nr:hypothetical protein Vadar_004768 [Vaccinium darrowii]KAH7856023.1 hypothetical protein Vadar_031748 [Vaccinium darrowii]
MEIAKSNFSEVAKIIKPVLRRAIYYGVPEIVEEIIASYPMAMYMIVHDDLDIFQYAIQCRRERVFNLIYQLDYGSTIVAQLDKSRNNGLHLAASLKHEQQIIVRASAVGPVLQMQRELQWFKRHRHAHVVLCYFCLFLFSDADSETDDDSLQVYDSPFNSDSVCKTKEMREATQTSWIPNWLSSIFKEIIPKW